MIRFLFLFLCLQCSHIYAQDWVQIGDDFDATKAYISGNGNTVAVGGFSGNTIKVYDILDGQYVEKGQGVVNQGSIIDINENGSRILTFEGGPIFQNPFILRVFEFSNDEWVQLGGDISDNNPNSTFGFNSIFDNSGNRIFINTFLASPIGDPTIAEIYVYEWSGSTWQQLGNTIQKEASNYGRGADFSGDGNSFIVGTFGDGTPAISYADVYEWDNGSWVQKGNTITNNEQDRLGWEVAINDDGSIVAVTIIGDESAGPFTGRVETYQWQNNDWEVFGGAVFGSFQQEQFGFSLEFDEDGDTFIAGSIEQVNLDRQSSVKVYEINGSNWQQKGQTISSDFEGANFGFTVSINNAGDRWASGNHYYLSGNTGPNFAKVFQTEEFSIPAPAEASFVVYPNPSRGEFTIFTNELSSAFSLTVLDQLGKLIYSEEYIDESSFSLNLDLQPGFYFLRLKDKSGTPLGVEKLIVH